MSSSQEKDHQRLVELSNAYYETGESLVSDQEFDNLCQQFENRYGTPFSYLGQATHQKTKLPVCMPSLQKTKDDHSLQLYLQRTASSRSSTYILSAKVDGISCLYVNDGTQTQLMTRGNGEIGSNISHLLPFLDLPSCNTPCIVRGELVLPVQVFRNSFQELAENPRNLVSGWINSKQIKPQYIRQLQFIAHSIPHLAMQDAFHQIKTFGFTPAYHRLVPRSDINETTMREWMEEFHQQVPYEMDGLVLTISQGTEELTVDNPKLSIAFKVQKECAQTTVKELVWQSSRYGTLCPKVILDPVPLSGVTIRQATAFHAKYVQDHHLGPGSRVTITRSGDVIPYIVSVDSPSEQALENIFPPAYEWLSDVQIQLRNPLVHPDVLCSQLVYLTEVCQIKGIKEATLRKWIEKGLVTNLDSFFTITKEQLLTVEGIKEKSASVMFQVIQDAKEKWDCKTLFLCSNLFPGFGEKKLQLIFQAEQEAIVSFLRSSQSYSPDYWIAACHQVGIKTMASKFVEGLYQCKRDYQNSPLLELALVHTSSIPLSKEKGPCQGILCFSGFRNAEWKERLEQKGYQVSDEVTKQTTCLLVTDLSSTTSKTEKARKYGIPIQLANNFLNAL